MRRGKLVLLGALLFFCGHAFLYAASEEPVWVLFEKGRASFRRREYGEALAYFKLVQSRQKFSPEAEIAIGDVYAVSAEIRLAEEQYRKAYRLKSHFEYPDKVYVALYRLVALYAQSRNSRLLEESLIAVIQENKGYYDSVYLKNKDAYSKVFLNDGLDRLLTLYRINGYRYVINAHAELGTYNYRHGRFEHATIHFLFAVIGIVSESFDEMRTFDPVYKFTTLKGFLADVLKRKNIREFAVERSDIFEILYYLGNAAHVLGNFKFAKELWRIVADDPRSVEYRMKSRNQLSSPVIEEYVDVSPKKIDFVWDF